MPVILPSGGGYSVHVPLSNGDPVLLLFSERDIARFKQTLAAGPPLTDDIMTPEHAVAIPGFMAGGAGPVAGGFVLQRNPDGGGGSPYIQITEDAISIHTRDDVHITVSQNAVTIEAASLSVVAAGGITVNGTRVAASGQTAAADGPGSHTHGIPEA